MSNFPNLNNSEDDENLVAFLRQYRPIAPPAGDNCEGKLMELVASQPVHKLVIPPLFWLFSSVIAASILLILGHNFGLKLSSQTANNDSELETFLANSWQGIMDGNNHVEQNSPEADWLIFTNGEKSK